ncbi:MAG: hypothetical protein HN994_02725 [Candidatus Marinimicrobia bacterium]|jgi:hypothetical protein|nr:hypothetical protein [Candidatus Neomarinimicrobiota bacterium]MBT5069022.1 hypothetical protein [Candidatus Neomarinimicrobiota bacterium]MBT6938274.1 hypothetical protein [Candidatus Neomarinimicrobiota bacterium]MBT6939283.1 hypothetical protein [Candidatus Neomarinimicrobiota bacterium]
MDNHVRRKRTYFHKRINQSKNIQFVRSLFFCVLIGITSHSLPYCQNIGNGEGQFSLDDLSFNLEGLSIEISPEDHPVYKASFSIGKMTFGFSDIRIMTKQRKGFHNTEIQIGGPDYSLDLLHLSIKTKIPDVITNILADLKKKRISVPTLGLTLIGRAMDLYYQDHPSHPDSINILFDEDYLSSNAYPFNQWEWSFSIISPSKIRATSTEKFIMGKGLIIELDLLNWEMSGYSIPNPDQNEWNNWEIIFDVNEVILQFLSQLNVELSDSSRNIAFSLRRGRFNLFDYTIIATPDQNLEQRASLKIGNYGISLRDINFNFNIGNGHPIMKDGSGSIILRNLEIKLPEEIYAQPEIKNMVEIIGIYNGLIKIRQLQVNGELGKDGNGKIIMTLNTPFAHIESLIQIHTNELGGQKRHYEFHNSDIKISHLSPGLSEAINQWELETNNRLPRSGDKIILKVYGDVEKPKIKGLH